MSKLSDIVLMFFAFSCVVAGIILVVTESTNGGSIDPAPVPVPVIVPVPAPVLDPDCDSECKEWVRKHNYYRDVSHPLTWDSELASQARDWATELNNIAGDDCKYGVSPPHGKLKNAKCVENQCGQNVACRTIGIKSPSFAMDNWYLECKDYNNSTKPYSNTLNKKVGHYTQMVWKDASKLGCAIVGKVAVCNYDDGNVVGQYANNVPDPKTNICKSA